MNEKYPVLIGYTHDGRCTKLHNVEEVAEFICNNGIHGNLLIVTEYDTPFISTIGIYIDKIADMEYREELLKILIPMQQELFFKALDDEE